MAAITPFIEEQNDPAETPLQQEVLGLSAGLAERAENAAVEAAHHGRPVAFHEGQIVAASIEQSHAELMQTAWLREGILASLSGYNYRVQTGDLYGKNLGTVYIVLDKPWPAKGTIPVPWSPGTGQVQQIKLLSWTKKMGTPSFSLPAGPTAFGGACPGANAAQSILTESDPEKNKTYQTVLRVLGQAPRLSQAVCQHCYAEGGQYSTANVQMVQVLRYAWAQQAVQDGTFAETMAYAIAHANYKQGKSNTYPPERHPGRYFRWHDSGDIFSAQHLAAMKAVANALPDVLFWAPTRCWATPWGPPGPKGPGAVNEINTPMQNLIVRPSAYHTNERAPENLGPGWAAGTVVFGVPGKPEETHEKKLQALREGIFDWDCQAYAVNNQAATCRHAADPTGQDEGCRACWRFPDLTINYTLH